MALTARDVAAELAAEISALPAGSRIASEHELMRRFGVGRSIARSALRILEERHLARRVQGAGTFVHRRVDIMVGKSRPVSLHESISRAGLRLKTVVKTCAPEADPALAARFGGRGTHRVTRLGYIDSSLAGFLDDRVVDGVVADLEVGLGMFGSLCTVLAGSGSQPVLAAAHVTLAEPPARVCHALELDEGCAAWFLEAHLVDAQKNQPLVYSRRWFRPDMVRLIAEL